MDGSHRLRRQFQRQLLAQQRTRLADWAGARRLLPLYGRVGVEQKLRTRIGFRQLEEALAPSKRLELADVQQLAFANRVYAAELVLPELLPALCLQPSASWRRRASRCQNGTGRPTSTVAARSCSANSGIAPRPFRTSGRVPLDPGDPVNTPNGISAKAPAGNAGRAQECCAKSSGSLHIPFDARLGDFQGDTRNGVRVPIHGAIGDVDGSYNSIHMSGELDKTGYNNVAWGTSYVQTVTFDDDGPVAQAMLLYGQSTDPKSPWYADQMPLLLAQGMERITFHTGKNKGGSKLLRQNFGGIRPWRTRNAHPCGVGARLL